MIGCSLVCYRHAHSLVQINSTQSEGIYQRLDRQTSASKWTATPVDLIFGSNTEAVAEVYATDDVKQPVVIDFVKAWVKVMVPDRFDIAENKAVE